MQENNLNKVCRDFMRGNCTRAPCRFIHDTKLCKNWYRNFQNNREASCKFKDNCRKNHFVVTSEGTGPIEGNNRRKPRNTESWEPPAPPYDMRIQIDTRKDKLSRELNSRDVLVATNIFGDFNDFELHDKLVSEIEKCKVSNKDLLKLWHSSREKGIDGVHLICDDKLDWKKECPTFTFVINRLVDYFGVKPNATRLNWYTSNEHYKPFHRDSAALYPEKQKKQNITIACSFGQTRDIVFQHLENKKTVCIPQGDGDSYTFGNQVNIDFRHGVSKGKEDEMSSRISIIIWGYIEGVEDT